MAKKYSSRGGGNKGKSPGTIKATVDKDSSVEVRQIQNGFIVRESGTTGKGRNQQYYSKEWFSKSNPVKINGTAPTAGTIRFGGRKG